MKQFIQYIELIVLTLCGIALGIVITLMLPQMLPERLLEMSPAYVEFQNLKARYGEIDNAYMQLERNYYKKVNEKELKEGMLKGLFKATGDPYTSYMTQKEYENFMIKSTGELQGIGVTLATDKSNNIIVVSTFEGSPAEVSGIKAGDIISAVNDVDYKGSEMDKAVSEMRGEPGSKVNVTYIRDGKSTKVSMVRKKITLQSVYASDLGDGNGYIAIKSFEINTPQEFETELHNFEMKGAKGLVIDLRQNGGGIVESGIKIADMLLDEGVLAYTKGKNDKEKIFMNTQKGKTNLPYVVLVDGGTASTSEIVAAGIKDNNGGKLVGTKSFGKGVIQTIMALPSKAAMKITVAQYFSPKGNVIHDVGITPDYVVELSPNATHDVQLEKALEVLKAEEEK